MCSGFEKLNRSDHSLRILIAFTQLITFVSICQVFYLWAEHDPAHHCQCYNKIYILTPGRIAARMRTGIGSARCSQRSHYYCFMAKFADSPLNPGRQLSLAHQLISSFCMLHTIKTLQCPCSVFPPVCPRTVRLHRITHFIW